MIGATSTPPRVLFPTTALFDSVYNINYYLHRVDPESMGIAV